MRVVGRVEPQRPVELQRTVSVTDGVDPRHELVEIAGLSPGPLPVLIFLRACVFLGAGNGASFAQLEPAVNAVAGAEGRGEEQPGAERGRAAVLQVLVPD